MAVASIFACEGQRKDPRGACVDKDARASVQGGAGRDHVVDKENAALRDALSRLEDAADVAAALVAIAQPVLRRRTAIRARGANGTAVRRESSFANSSDWL